MLRLKNLSLRAGDFKLHNISLDIAAGEYFVILGHTGSGKTTLLEAISGIRRADGELFLHGKSVTLMPPEKRNIGFVYQDLMLFPHLNVEQNIRFSGAFRSDTLNEKEYEELVSLLRIEDILKRGTDRLSGGEKQRVALARALYGKPETLLLDEPLSAIDPSMRDEITALLKKIIGRFGVTTVHVTHNFREAALLADRIAILLNGRIEQLGRPDEVLTKPKNLNIARFLGYKNILPGRLFGRNETHLSIDPNAVRLYRDPPSGSNAFRVKLIETGYGVDHIKIYVELEGERVFLKAPGTVSKNADLKPGEWYWAVIDTEGVIPL